MNNIFYTMIVYVDHEELLRRSLKSIFSLPKSEYDMIKLVVVGPVVSDQVKEICAKYAKQLPKKNYCYIEAEGADMAAGYNMAIPEIRGKYVNFSLASTVFTPGTLTVVNEVANVSDNPKLISLAPWTINEKQEIVKYTVSPEVSTKEIESIRFYQTPEKLQLMFHAYFIRTFLINDKGGCKYFQEDIHDDALNLMLLDLLSVWRGYVFIPELKLQYTTQLEDNTSVFHNQYEKEWYIDFLKKGILPFEENYSKNVGPLEPAIKIAILYYIFSRYNCNYNDRTKGVLKDEYLKEFLELTGKALTYIDNRIIFNKHTDRQFQIPRSVRLFFMKIKAAAMNKKLDIVEYNDMFYAWIHEADAEHVHNGLEDSVKKLAPDFAKLQKENLIYSKAESLMMVDQSDSNIPSVRMVMEYDNFVKLGAIDKEQVILSAINYDNGLLEIDGTFSAGDMIESGKIKLSAILNEKEIPVDFSPIYGRVKLFGKTFHHKYQFHVQIPVRTLSGNSQLQFATTIGAKQVIVRIRSGSVYSHLTEKVKAQYWNINDEWGMNIVKERLIKIYRMNASLLAKKEKEFCTELSRRRDMEDEAAEKALEIRKQYFARKKEFRGRRIWITFDKLYKAGDNGEYIYHYVTKQDDGIEIFYMIKDDSPDCQRLQDAGENVLVWGTEEALVTILYAEAILTTHANVVSYCGFDKPIIPYICDLFNPVNICIQHGLTTQDIAQFQNRLFDNLQLYLCASPNEIANISRPIYGYDEEQIALTGVARYDGLKSNDQRQILITPTWRRNIANANIAHFKKGHNDNFKESTYFKLYNRLINDKRLIECAKKYNYKIVYLLHPAVSAQIDDYDRNDYVELMQGAGDTNYEKMLTESSLMVTDYSGVQFDFAYQRKPILYYHPAELPPHYEQSKAYQYDRDGFGPIIDNHEELVNQLCDYMKNDCKTKPKYIERANKFFAYDDFDNAKRIYAAILKCLEEKR